MFATIFWIVIAAIGIVIDLTTSAFLFVWFSIGAIAAMISNLLEITFGYQVIIFSITTIVSFLIGYPIVKKKFKISQKTTPLMEETYIGKVFRASNDISSNQKNARIKVSGIYWAAINEGESIKAGERFEIIGIEGSKLKINKFKGDE